MFAVSVTDVPTSQPREVNTRSVSGETQPGFEKIMLSDVSDTNCKCGIFVTPSKLRQAKAKES